MTKCSRCHDLHDRNGRYCRPCHAWKMRKWRRDKRYRDAQLRRDFATAMRQRNEARRALAAQVRAG